MNTKVSEAGISISDNQGNSLNANGGFIEATCSGKKQDVNMVKVAELGAVFGANFANAATSARINEETSARIGEIIKGAPSVPAPSDIPDKSDFSKLIATASSSIAKSVQSVDATVTLKEGLPSPLANLCVKARQEGAIRDRK